MSKARGSGSAPAAPFPQVTGHWLTFLSPLPSHLFFLNYYYYYFNQVEIRAEHSAACTLCLLYQTELVCLIVVICANDSPCMLTQWGYNLNYKLNVKVTGGLSRLSKGETEWCLGCLKGDERVTDMEKPIWDNGNGRGNGSCNTRDESGRGKHLCSCENEFVWLWLKKKRCWEEITLWKQKGRKDDEHFLKRKYTTGQK